MTKRTLRIEDRIIRRMDRRIIRRMKRIAKDNRVYSLPRNDNSVYEG